MTDLTRFFLNRVQAGAVELPEDAEKRLVGLPGIRAVVFDVYGTLFSSGVGDISLAAVQDRDEVVKATLADAGAGVTELGTDVAFDKLLNGWIQRHQKREQERGVRFPEVEIREVWSDFVQRLAVEGYIQPDFSIEIESLVVDYESRVNPVQPMPLLRETLDALKTKGYSMSIISNAQFYTPLLFPAFLGMDIKECGFCTECSVWSYKLLEGKPSTRLYEVAADQLMRHHGIRPEEALYVGNDMLNDMLPAAKLGFRTALFAGDRKSLRRRSDQAECERLKPDIELTGLAQILECV